MKRHSAVAVFAFLFFLYGCAFQIKSAPPLVVGLSENPPALETPTPSVVDENAPCSQEKLFNQVWYLLSLHYPPIDDTEEMKNCCKQKMATGKIGECFNDKNSNYIAPNENNDENIDTKGAYGGIGLVFKEVDAAVVIVEMLPGPALESGNIQVGDRLVEIDNKSVEGKNLAGIANMIRGKPGSEVSITVERLGVVQPPVVLMRRKIIVYGTGWTIIANDILYIRIREFNARELPGLIDALRDNIKTARAKTAILDLRGNPGGFLYSVLASACLFFNDMDTKLITEQTKKEPIIIAVKDEDSEAVRAGGDCGAYANLPLAVLVNSDSASASEILAGILLERGRAILVGEKTHGKGTVQITWDLCDKGMLRLTMAEYFIGKNEIKVDGIGIMPDVEVKAKEGFVLKPLVSENAEVDIENDIQLQKAIEILKEKQKTNPR